MRRCLPVCMILAAAALACASFGAPEDRAEKWKAVEEAQKKGLPKTAIEHLQRISEAALQEKAYPEAVKAVAYRIVFESRIEGDSAAECIRRMQAALTAAPAEMLPAMHTLLAHWFWRYYEQNRWRFLQRTQAAAPAGEDFTTWDLARIFAEIDRWFARALSSAEALKRIPIAQYDALLEKGTMPDSYRPTLYDFIAHEALAFYTSAEQAGARSEDAFELSAASPILGSTEEFMGWKAATADTDAPEVKAIALYQALLRFHRDDPDRTAFLHVDLERLSFGYREAAGEEKAARYKAALRRVAAAAARHELSSLALHALAQVLYAEDALVDAHRTATEGRNRFPESPGGKLCGNLIGAIERKSLAAEVERVWTAPFPKIAVLYRNLARVHFRVVRNDWTASLEQGRFQGRRYGGRVSPDELAEILAAPPVLAWSADVPPAADYHDRVEEIQPPEDLAPGWYFLVLSASPDFGKDDNEISCAEFWVSELALVLRTENSGGVIEGFVLDARSGEPLAGAEVRAWRPKEERGARDAWESLNPKTTGEDGLFRWENVRVRSYMVHARRGTQELATARDFHISRHSPAEKPAAQTIFFTDRKLYRPGQTIRYKALCMEVERSKDRYRVLPGQQVIVVFRDANGKEIDRRTLRTNDAGSASGSFVAPRGRLTGGMSLVVEGSPAGRTWFNVEEYKLPRFRVTFDAPVQAPKLGEKVVLAGKAVAYTGAPVDGAKVKFRVARRVRYPAWWRWYYWDRESPESEAREIAHGTAMTAADGSFAVTFAALPDLAVAEKEEPVFRFEVNADVTDNAGETRSGEKVVSAGYTALAATIEADSWQVDAAPVEIAIRTEMLDGTGIGAEGIVKVHRLTPPSAVAPAPLRTVYNRLYWARGNSSEARIPADRSTPDSWPLGEIAAERGIATDAAGNAKLSFALPAGAYRAVLSTQDRFGKPVTALCPIEVLAPNAGKLAIKVPDRLAAPRWKVEPGEEFAAVWGSGYDRARAYIEIEHRGKVLQKYWTDPARTQVRISQPVTESMRGGFTLRTTMVRENRAYLHSERVEVPWSNKDLTITWERFVSKLAPGQKETWTAVIAGPNATRVAAEMVAGLYDASLDAYLPHSWPAELDVFRRDWSALRTNFQNCVMETMHLAGAWARARVQVDITYRRFPALIRAEAMRQMLLEKSRGSALGPPASVAADGAMMEGAGEVLQLSARNASQAFGYTSEDADESAPAKKPDLDAIAARANLQETAFFFPHLVAGEDGTVRMEFTMPEALTEWRFMGFAHTETLASGYLEARAVTSKDIMVQPNAPRFLREGDALEFTVKVTNMSASLQAGSVRLTLSDARTSESMDKALGNAATDLAFQVPARESRSYAWRLAVPDGMGFLVYKAVGSTGALSDGEEGFLPVLPRRVLVTESLPLAVRGPAEKSFDFARLRQSGASDTLRHQSLNVQMVSNPAWYAVMSLPYLMEFPHECMEQVFNRYYANALARHIAARDPKIRRVFEQWKGTDALESPLAKNQNLKAVMLEETPWVRDAARESEARRNVGILFDANRLQDESDRAFRKLAEGQHDDGAWPWFPGGRGNDYITLYIAAGFGRLRHLGVDCNVEPVFRALARLDGWIHKEYRSILKDGRADRANLSSTIALYLYARTFFLKERAVAKEHREAFDYFVAQAKAHWVKAADRQSQGHLALALARLGEAEAAAAILRSLKERAVSDPLLGMHWRDAERSWWWYRAPIETQAVMIEAFQEVAKDVAAVAEQQVWLLSQKRTQSWPSTKATADAVYALLLRGADLLASDAVVEVALGGTPLVPEKIEAGTGYHEHRFAGPEITPALGAITVKKVDAGLAWGSVNWQYLEDMRKITPYEGTPLTIRKSLYVRENTAKGPALVPFKNPRAVGDALVVRLELRVDRDMEFVHLKDRRGSGVEPASVLSGYRYRDGLGYYESTRDTASHFFIDYLPRGTYVLEYETRIVHKGAYQSGFAEIQCMYAPEFNSHSESVLLDVR